MNTAMKNNKLLLFPLLLILAEMTAYLSNDMYLPAMPDLMRDFQVGADQIQLTLSSWFLGSMSMQLLVGPFSDRLGRRPVLICGMLLFVVSTLVCVQSSQLSTLIAARFVQGSTVCFIIVAGYASIHELFNQKNAIHLLARMNSITVLAPAFGPFIGGFILMGANWRWTFWPLFILGLVVLVLLSKWMPEPLPPEKRHPLKIKTLVQQYRSLLRNRRFILLLLSSSFAFCGFIAWLATGPFLVNEQFQEQPYLFGCFQLFVFGFYIFANHKVKELMEKVGVDALIQRGLYITLFGSAFAICLTLFFPAKLFGLLFGMAWIAFGFGFCSAPLQRLTIEAANEPMGSRMALISTAYGGFGLLATALVHWTYNGKPSSLAAILLFTSLLSGLAYLIEACVSAHQKPNLSSITF